MDIKKSNRDSNRRIENGRMIYYQQTASQGFWEDIWSRNVPPDYYKSFQAGKLYDYEKMYKRH